MATLIRDVSAEDMPWLLAASEAIGGPMMVSGGVLHDLADYPALVAEIDGTPRGFLSYRLGNVRAYGLAILSTEQGQGLGSDLLTAFENRAREAGKTQIRISTSNDNLPALRFVQLRGYKLRQLIPGAHLEANKLKGIAKGAAPPGIYGIEMRDEIVLNKDL